jgi:DNA-directed RNA polymerase specialized sigma24 family protein
MQRRTRHQPSDAPALSSRQRAAVRAHLPSLFGAGVVYTGSGPAAELLVRDALRSAAADPVEADDPVVWLHAHLWARFVEYQQRDEPLAADHRTTGATPPPSLRAAVAALPPAARASVHLVDVEGLSYARLARVLGTSRQEAAALLHDARRQLVSVVASAGAGRPGAAS